VLAATAAVPLFAKGRNLTQSANLQTQIPKVQGKWKKIHHDLCSFNLKEVVSTAAEAAAAAASFHHYFAKGINSAPHSQSTKLVKKFMKAFLNWSLEAPTCSLSRYPANCLSRWTKWRGVTSLPSCCKSLQNHLYDLMDILCLSHQVTAPPASSTQHVLQLPQSWLVCW
jgi:hypothetical protein